VPPLYDLTKIPGPLAFFSGKYDRLGDPIDTLELVKYVNKSLVYWRNDLDAGHLTFMWGKNMTYFEDVVHLINKYS